MQRLRHIHTRAALGSLVFLAARAIAFAQEDEIQVYDASIAPQGKFNLTWHNNFTPEGMKQPAFPGGLSTDKTLNGVPEWAYGAATWFEAGLYLPLYSLAQSNESKLDGFKLRALFVSPHADDRTFVYGMNFEFSLNSRHWNTRRATSEVRGIIGWHLHPVDIIVNPIVDTSYYGGFKSLELVPAERVAYNLHNTWALALEEYGQYGTLRKFLPWKEQAHNLFWVIDKDTKPVNVEAGIGFGLTAASDKIVLKLILSHDLN